jgi:hypothetical protein
MQRWIVMGVVAMMLMLGGGVFAYSTYKQNRPHPMWVPLPLNPALPGEKRQEILKELTAKLKDEALLLQVSKDLELPRKLHLRSDEEAAREVSKRLFVKLGDVVTPMGGTAPSLNVGVSGKAKDAGISGEIAMRLMQDVWKILGIKPPPRKDTF